MLVCPHLVARRLKAEARSADREVLGVGYGPASFLSVQLTPTDPGTAYERWGVETKEPYFFLHTGRLEDAPVGTLLSDQNGRYWEVRAVSAFDFGNASDHVSGVAELLQYDPTTIDPVFVQPALQAGAGRFPDPGDPA